MEKDWLREVFFICPTDFFWKWLQVWKHVRAWHNKYINNVLILPNPLKNDTLFPMNPNIEAEIAQIKSMVEENNKILKKIHTAGRWSMILGFIKWIVYITLIIGSYALIQPYLTQMIDTYNGIQESAGALSDIKNQTQDINFDALKEYFK